MAQMIEDLLGMAEDCEWDCRGELTADSKTASEAVAEELLQQANCGGRTVSSRWEDGQAPVLVSGAGHDSLPMSEITEVLPLHKPILWNVLGSSRGHWLCTSQIKVAVVCWLVAWFWLAFYGVVTEVLPGLS